MAGSKILHKRTNEFEWRSIFRIDIGLVQTDEIPIFGPRKSLNFLIFGMF